jgi:uncharacterized cupredoxin-like copper-binding protein
MPSALTAALTAAGLAILGATSTPALAHGEETHAKSKKPAMSTEEYDFGVEGKPGKAVRTVALSMDDTMRYSRPEIRVRQGETVTLAVTNKGKLMHELVIGTEEELRKHAELMVKYPEMKHQEPYMAHVRPGSTEQITWRFTKPGTFHFGCLVPGHFEAGMKGSIVVTARP